MSSTFSAAVRRKTRLPVVLVTSLAAMAATSLALADGIDVSHWQGAINWTSVDRAGVAFAFMKATESTTYTDTRFATNWAAARQAGIYRGAYHFARPSRGTAVAQAKYFVSRVGSFKGAGTLPPVLDLETTGGLSPAELRTWVSNWLTTTETLTGRTPILYFSSYFWIDHLGNSTAFTRYPLWVAHYTTASAPIVPGGWRSWTFWQYTSSGRLSGIAGNVDMNRFHGTGAQLAALANGSGGSTGPVPPGPAVPPAVPTALTMSPDHDAVSINAPVTFAGDLSRTLAPVATLPNLPVTLWARSAGTTGWSRAGAGTTDSAGHYAITARVPRPTDYRAAYAGGTKYAARTSPTTLVTTPPRAVVRASLSKNKAYRVHKGARVQLYGHLTTPSGALPERSVRLYKRPARGGRWSFVWRATSVAPAGRYAINVHPRWATTYKVLSLATLRYRADASRYVTVRVR